MLVKPAPVSAALAATLGDKPPRYLQIRHPVTREIMPEEGWEVESTDLHWARLLQDGDIVVVKASSKRSADQ